jgi:hypothetical protein
MKEGVSDVFEVKLENVFLYEMKEQMPTVLLWNGKLYVLRETDEESDAEEEEPAVHGKTVELQTLVKKRHGKPGEADVVDRGEVVARMGSGTLIYRKPLDEMLGLKEKNKMTPLNMASVLHKYYPGIKHSTTVVYRSGYQNFIMKSKDADVRLNVPVKEHETVTEKDKEHILKVLYDANNRGIYPEFESILRELDMTDYKLRLALEKLAVELKVEMVVVDKKEVYRLVV